MSVMDAIERTVGGELVVDWGGPRGSGPIALPVRESRDGNDLLDAHGEVVYHVNGLIAAVHVDFTGADTHFPAIRALRDTLNKGGPQAERLKRRWGR